VVVAREGTTLVVMPQALVESADLNTEGV
jgi:hypothetical protein